MLRCQSALTTNSELANHIPTQNSSVEERLHVLYETKWMLSEVSEFKRKVLIKNLILPFSHTPDKSVQWITVCYR